jgi:hypothetical protein
MNDSPRKVSPLRQRMIEEMRMRQLAPKTRHAYIRAGEHIIATTRRTKIRTQHRLSTTRPRPSITA